MQYIAQDAQGLTELLLCKLPVSQDSQAVHTACRDKTLIKPSRGALSAAVDSDLSCALLMQ